MAMSALAPGARRLAGCNASDSTISAATRAEPASATRAGQEGGLRAPVMEFPRSSAGAVAPGRATLASPPQVTVNATTTPVKDPTKRSPEDSTMLSALVSSCAAAFVRPWLGQARPGSLRL